MYPNNDGELDGDFESSPLHDLGLTICAGFNESCPFGYRGIMDIGELPFISFHANLASRTIG